MRLRDPDTTTLVSDNGIGYPVATLAQIEDNIRDLTGRLDRCSPNLPKLRAMINRDRDQLLDLWASRQETT